MGKLKLHNLARLPLFYPPPPAVFSPSSSSLILQMLCLHQYKGLRSSLSLSLLQDTAAVSAGSGIHIDLPLGTHINEIWSFFFFFPLSEKINVSLPRRFKETLQPFWKARRTFAHVCLFSFFLLRSLFYPAPQWKHLARGELHLDHIIQEGQGWFCG